MYLNELHIMLYDGKTGDPLATGTWENSPLHKFRGADVVVKDVMDEIFTRVKVGGP
jgi:hypothetical protein